MKTVATEVWRSKNGLWILEITQGIFENQLFLKSIQDVALYKVYQTEEQSIFIEANIQIPKYVRAEVVKQYRRLLQEEII